jgi:putative ABC transport system ATP-binding protein
VLRDTDGSVVSGRDLIKRYGEGAAAVDALRGVTVAFEAGSFAAIMGPSGSGKSTLMHLLAGLDRPTSGEVSLGGSNLDGLDDAELTRLRRTRVGFVFQAFNLLPVLTAEENIVLPLRIAGQQIDTDWLERLLGALDLQDRRRHRPSELSGGQQQRVALARALLPRPAVIFADEPTGNLDSTASEDILKLLRTAVDDFAQTIVMVTHDSVAAANADRIVFLNDGLIVRESERLSAPEILDTLKAVRR